jgi:hypothetical protein
MTIKEKEMTWNVRDLDTWKAAVNGIRNGGNGKTYVIAIGADVSVPITPVDEKTFGGADGITVTLEGSGSLSPADGGTLLRIGKGQTVVARDITLRGRSDSKMPLVTASGGEFVMEGGAVVSGNFGGGVSVSAGGKFIMKDHAAVKGNSNLGVFIDYVSAAITGTFIMKDKAIVTGNFDGGVYVGKGGTFIMEGGMVWGNTGRSVNVDGGTFINQGGRYDG